MGRGTLGSRTGLQVIDIRSSLRLTYGIPCIFNKVRPNRLEEFYARSSIPYSIFARYTIERIVTFPPGAFNRFRRSNASSRPSDIHMLTILLVILVLMALGALPTWPHSRSWGYYPSGGLGLVVVILVILLLLGRI
jgi:hypothetical protein